MWSTSRNPRVVMTRVRATSYPSSALVAIVVPCTSKSTPDGSIAARRQISSTPATTVSAGSNPELTLRTRLVPASVSWSTKSTNVPPTSIPIALTRPAYRSSAPRPRGASAQEGDQLVDVVDSLEPIDCGPDARPSGRVEETFGDVLELLLDLRLPVLRLIPRELDLALQQPSVRKRDRDGLAESLLFEEEPIGLSVGDNLDPRQQPQQGRIVTLLLRVEARAERLAQDRRCDRVGERELSGNLPVGRGIVDSIGPQRRHPDVLDVLGMEIVLVDEQLRRPGGGR